MTSRDFCFWLQGYLELTHNVTERELTPAQVDCIKRHLALVFKHEIDPQAGPVEVQEALNKIHDPGSFPRPIDPHDGPMSTKYRC